MKRRTFGFLGIAFFAAGTLAPFAASADALDDVMKKKTVLKVAVPQDSRRSVRSVPT